MSLLKANNMNIVNRVINLGTLTTNTTLYLNEGNIINFTVGGDLTLTLNNNTNLYNKVTLIITNGASHTLTWPSNITWLSSFAPYLKFDGIDIIYLITNDNGTTWYGDASSNGNNNGVSILNLVLSKDSWNDTNYNTKKYYTYTISNSEIDSTDDIKLNLNMGIVTLQQIDAYQLANIYIGNKIDGLIELRAYDEKPTIDIPITLYIEDVKSKIMNTVSWDNITGKNVSVAPTANYIPQGDSNGKIDNGWLKDTISSNTTGNAATATTATTATSAASCTGNAATATSCTGNAATATTATNQSGGSVNASSITGPLTSIISSASITTTVPTANQLAEGQFIFVVE